MDEYGISVYNASGKFVGITNLAGQLHDKLGKLTQEQRNAALATIFGSDAIRSASVLYQQGSAGIQGWILGTHGQKVPLKTSPSGVSTKATASWAYSLLVSSYL